MTRKPALRSVVYTGARSFEHLMLETAARTLCGKAPGHINPSPVKALPTAGSQFDGDFCRICITNARDLWGVR